MTRLHIIALTLIGTLVYFANAVPNNLVEAFSIRGDTPMVKWSWQSCGSDADSVKTESFDVFPSSSAEAGKDLTIKVQGSVTERVEDGAIVWVEVKVGLIVLLRKTYDLCEIARDANFSLQCPVEEGPYSIEEDVALPNQLPPGKFIVTAKGYDVNDVQLFCIKGEVQVQR
ncbi:hypothetical protein HGRIS_006325 [Hohenbuehelia grisea]|uniref:Phosphatidylglycerol/phosphatidylinositol transfer protein n=1 Tax=Hohenbuehelia grisea TaxID=104357 RepID=A0ABR3JZK6_9AGAR